MMKLPVTDRIFIVDFMATSRSTDKDLYGQVIDGGTRHP